MNVLWKHRKAELELGPLLAAAERCGKALVEVFPRPLEEIVCSLMPVAFESRVGLTVDKVASTLSEIYGVQLPQAERVDSGRVAGYTFAAGTSAVVFSDSSHGIAFERFTRAHEIAHIVVEYLPMLARVLRNRKFANDPKTQFFARRDSELNLKFGTLPPKAQDHSEGLSSVSEDRSIWLREAIANACAAELLAPYREVRKLTMEGMPKPKLVTAMSKRFGLSIQSARIRLTDLGIG